MNAPEAEPLAVETPPPLPQPSEADPEPSGPQIKALEPPASPAQPVPEVPRPPSPQDLSRIAQDFQIRKTQVEAVVQLLDDGNTVPFITRYRKVLTGGLNEDVIRRIQDRLKHLRALADRKQTILRTLANQGKLTDELTNAILESDHPRRLEDLYLPFKPRKKTPGVEAKEKGLEPLALAIWNRDEAVAKLEEVLPGLVDEWKQLHGPEDVLTGVKQILAEKIADLADIRGYLRNFLWDTAVLRSVKIETLPEGKGKEFHEYFDFREPIRTIPPHRILAVNRGEREQVIRVFLEVDSAVATEIAIANLPFEDHPHKEIMVLATKDAVERIILPNLEREIRRSLTEKSQDHAVQVFARNLRGLLMQPPLRNVRVLAIDPGLRNGCKLAVLDEKGSLLDEAVVYPHQPKKEVTEAKRKIEQLIRKYQTPVIAIGNGTACRETEQLISDLLAEFANRALSPATAVASEPAVVAETPRIDPPAEPPSAEVPPPVVEPLTATIEVSSPLGPATTSVAGVMLGLPGETSLASTEISAKAESIATPVPTAEPTAPPPPLIDLTGLPDPPDKLSYVIVSEAGASDYSASAASKEEFPQYDASVRSTVSIGRRLQDPLAELVKIDPQHLGVGLYQHDLKPKQLRESLEAVIESCVNHIGVDLNTASVSLLKHVSGLNALAARELINYRNEHGPFKSLEQLKALPQIGDSRFVQAAGFLKIRGGDEPLDQTWLHPENYETARIVLAELGFTPRDLSEPERVAALRDKLNHTDLEAMAKKLKVHPILLDDIFAALARPGRDPRDDLPPPIFKTGILKIEDIKPGMELKGTVLNVVPFGAFIDIGVKESGLVHISQLANRYIKSPYDVVVVGDVVTCWVIEVKAEEKKISLSMIPPHQPREREPRREDAPRPPRSERRPAAPRGDRPPPQERPPQDGPRPQRRRFEARTPQHTPQQAAPPAAAPPRSSKPKPIPKLTEEKKTGKAALNTFGELMAFFKAKEEPTAESKGESSPSEPDAPASEASTN